MLPTFRWIVMKNHFNICLFATFISKSHHIWWMKCPWIDDYYRNVFIPRFIWLMDCYLECNFSHFIFNFVAQLNWTCDHSSIQDSQHIVKVWFKLNYIHIYIYVGNIIHVYMWWIVVTSVVDSCYRDHKEYS